MNTTAEWAEGYHASEAYPNRYYAEQSPAWIDFALSLQHQIPPRVHAEQPFTYLELGCANGWTLNQLAASFPQGTFVGVDFVPTHIANAQALAHEAELDNVSFMEASFEQCLTDQGLTDERGHAQRFDYIVMHGIWSWVGEAHRQQCLQLVAKHLKPSGCVYVSYNTLPGWADKAPLRHLLIHQAQWNPSCDAHHQALLGQDWAQQLMQQQAQTFEQNPRLKSHLASLADKPANYLAQEYLNQSWDSFYCDQVVQQFVAAKCQWVASATAGDDAWWLRLTVTQENWLQTQGELSQQLALDFLVNQNFRRDLFVKARRTDAPLQQWQRLCQQGFMALPALNEASTSAHWTGLTQVQQDWLKSLQQAPASLNGAAVSGDDLSLRQAESWIKCLQQAWMLGWIVPVNLPMQWSSPLQATLSSSMMRFNQALLRSALVDKDASMYISTLYGLALPVSDEHMMVWAVQQDWWSPWAAKVVPVCRRIQINGQWCQQLESVEAAARSSEVTVTTWTTFS